MIVRLVACAAILAIGCRGCRDDHGHSGAREDDDRDEQSEERGEQEEAAQLNYWRVVVAISGAGRVRSPAGDVDCASDGSATHGTCGPHLFAFPELAPPLLHATGALGWRFDHWRSSTRRGPMPDGPLYLNGTGYRDDGSTEQLTAVFVATPP